MYQICTIFLPPWLTVLVEFKNSIGVHPENKISTGVNLCRLAREINFHWDARQSTGIRNYHRGANMSIQISLGFTPVGHHGRTPAPWWHPGQPLETSLTLIISPVNPILLWCFYTMSSKMFARSKNMREKCARSRNSWQKCARSSRNVVRSQGPLLCSFSTSQYLIVRKWEKWVLHGFKTPEKGGHNNQSVCLFVKVLLMIQNRGQFEIIKAN